MRQAAERVYEQTQPYRYAIYLSNRADTLPDGPERLALMHEARDLITAYMPQKYNVHRIVTWLAQPRVVGLRAPMYGNQFWQFVDIEDNGKRTLAAK